MEGILIRVAILDADIAVYQVSISCEREDNVKVVEETMDLYIREWLAVTSATKYLGYITESKENFRVKRAFTWKYKGQRKRDKPKWYLAMRQYVQEEWGFQNVRGIEADDALTIAAEILKSQGHDPIIVTEDKDLLQYPCLHYNPNKDKEVFRITEEQGHFNLWHQVITGDRTDNIPGVSHAITESRTGSYNKQVSEIDKPHQEKAHMYKKYPLQELYGGSTAEKYLKGFPPSEYAMRVWELYVDKYEDPEDEGSLGYGDLRFCETFDLIYMLTKAPEGVTVEVELKDPPSPKGVKFMDF